MEGQEGANGQQQQQQPGGQQEQPNAGGQNGQQPSGQQQGGQQQEQQNVTALPKWAQDLISGQASKISTFETQQSQAEQQRQQAEQNKLAEKGEFKKLYEQSQTRIAELEGKLAEKDLQALRSTIASEFHLPADLAKILVGGNEGELKANAAILAKHIKAPTAPSTEAGKQTAAKSPAARAGESGKQTNAAGAGNGAGDNKRYSFQAPGDVTW